MVRVAHRLLLSSFLFTSLNILPLRNWVFVHQTLPLGCFHGENGALAIVQRLIVPEEIELPELAMQIRFAPLSGTIL
jgi:hypothetical protein